MSARFHPAARREADAAIDWTAEHWSPALAVRFNEAFERAVDAIAANPLAYPEADDAPPGFDVRQVVVRKSLYRVVYLNLDGRSVIVAVAHPSRKPGYWLDRLPAN